MQNSPKLSRYRCFEIFSQSTGVEIRDAVKSHDENGQTTERAGRVLLRFFKLTPKTKADDVTQIRFICEPDEAYALALMISQVANSAAACKEKLNPHKFSSAEHGETVTTLAVEKWERGGKSGYALTVGRGKDFISVPTPLSKFVFAGELLKEMALEQCWVERAEKRA
jgi:hypothetical protein